MSRRAHLLYPIPDLQRLQFITSAASSLITAQPLLVSGVTGPITIFNKTIYDTFVQNGSGGEGFDYLQFIG
jgi:hypothetical protein